MGPPFGYHPYISGSLLLSGDFNVISNISKKIGGRITDTFGMHDFQNFLMQEALIDPGFMWDPFTWCNNRRGTSRIGERLDSVLINMGTRTIIRLCNLPRIYTDHLSLCIKFQMMGTKHKHRFIFQRMWTDRP